VDVARSEQPFFPETDLETLASAIDAYQHLGCWAGGLAITPELYLQAQRVFLHCGAVGRAFPYSDVVV
jgi:NitT/TauT family transport system substrate-binding protein